MQHIQVSVGLLYALFLMSTMYCVSQHESYIGSFYFTKKALLEEAGGMTPAEIEKIVTDGRRAAYDSYSWMAYGLMFLVFGIAAFDLLPGRASLDGDCKGILGLVLQLLIVGIYVAVVQVSPRGAPWWRKTWLVQLVCAALIITSAGIFLATPYKAIGNTTVQTTKTPSPDSQGSARPRQ